MKKNIFLFLLYLLVEFAYSQDDKLNMFCSIQTMFINQKIKNFTMPDSAGAYLENMANFNSFSLHQMDIFLSRAFLDKFNAFVDLEFTLNYSSQKGWGNFSVQEAWFNYKHSDLLNIKVGWLFPAFNNLNEVKNRLVLLPYIIRPIVYEEMYSNLPYVKEYIPEHAYIQLSGFYNIMNFRMDYAGYLGNSDDSFISSKSFTPYSANGHAQFQPQSLTPGIDTKSFNTKLKGGRLGIRTSNESFRFGLSITHDKTKSMDSLRLDQNVIPISGETPRWRFGIDFRLSKWDIELESEFIHVTYGLSSSAADDMGINFIFLNLLYNFTDKLYAFGGFQVRENKYINDKESSKFFGFGYRFNENLVGKMQYSESELTQNKVFGVSASSLLPHYVAAAVSLYF